MYLTNRYQLKLIQCGSPRVQHPTTSPSQHGCRRAGNLSAIFMWPKDMTSCHWLSCQFMEFKFCSTMMLLDTGYDLSYHFDRMPGWLQFCSCLKGSLQHQVKQILKHHGSDVYIRGPGPGGLESVRRIEPRNAEIRKKCAAAFGSSDWWFSDQSAGFRLLAPAVNQPPSVQPEIVCDLPRKGGLCFLSYDSLGYDIIIK